MLTLRDPIQLHIAQSLTGNAEAFGARIMGNYSLLGAHYTPKDLLFLLTAPPELPEGQGGMTTLVEQNTSVDARTVTLDVINHVVNRILLDGTNQFTYQDQVYITSVLNRLGVTDVNQFMEQVRQLRVENESTIHLTRLYREEVRRLLERREAGERTPALPLPAAAGEGEEQSAQDPGTALSMSILRRLDTANLYQKIHAFQHSWSAAENHIHHNELRLSEFVRFGNSLELAQLKQEIYQQPGVLLQHHINHYETGGLLEPPRDEEQVLSQAAVSTLVSAVDNTVVEVLNRPQFRREQWLRLENAVWQTAENALIRFETYHTEYNPPPAPAQPPVQEAWNQYTREIRAYTRLYEITHPGEHTQIWERSAPVLSQPAMVHPPLEEEKGGEQGRTTVQSPEQPEKMVTRERLEKSRLERMWASQSSVRELLFRQERRLSAYEKLRSQYQERTLEQRVRTERDMGTPPPIRTHMGETEGGGGYPPVSLTLREAEEQAPEILVEQLQRIDQQNRTMWQSVQQAAMPRREPIPRGPDLSRTMRDGLRALESPELALRELAQRREQPPPAQIHLTAQEQAILQQADPAARALYQRVLAYHKDPDMALEQGLVRPAGMGALQADLKGAERAPVMEHPEPAAPQEVREVREESERVLQQVIHLTKGRERAEAQPVKPPQAVKFIHKREEPQVTEELLEQLQAQRTQHTVKTESRDEITRQNIHRTDVIQQENQVVRQTTEGISELLNRTLARQMKTISEQVYRQMERRLQTERSRRGRL